MSITTSESKRNVPVREWNADRIKRYRRHLILHEIGTRGQEYIASSRILVVGAGGLGSSAIAYLAAAGVGEIGIIDGDKVELSNLQRQILYTTTCIGEKKVSAARQRVEDINPDINVTTYDTFLDYNNAESIISQYDFVCEGSDNYCTKLLVNDICVRLHKAFSMGSLFRFTGQTFTHIDGSACWRCIYGATPANGGQSCGQAGVLGTVPGIIGSIQATEAIKFVTHTGQLLTNRLLTLDVLTMNFNMFETSRDIRCPACGAKPTIFRKEEYEQTFCKS